MIYHNLTNLVLPNNPREMPFSGKYGATGLFTAENLDPSIPLHLAEKICTSANFSLSKSSWNSYKTTENMVKLCQTEVNRDLSFPFTETKTMIFTGWLIDRGVSHSTISKYLSGLRQLHLTKGHTNFNLRSDLIKQILTRRRNQNNIEETTGEKKTRIPVTPKLMLLIKKDLSEIPINNSKKLLIWSLSTILFSGGFRVGEILPSSKNIFDPYSTLLEKDVEIKTITVNNEQIQTLQVKLKTEKTNKTAKHTLVDIYASYGPLCPIRAFTKYTKNRSISSANPLFRDSTGANYTPRDFNAYLHQFSDRHLELGNKTLTSHSFRAGMTTLLAELGYSDEEIMSWGRWSSKAFETYIKAPRSKRMAMAQQITKLT